MVSAHGSCKAGSDADDEHLLTGDKHAAHDRDQNGERSPACSGGKCQEQSDQEDDHRKKDFYMTGRSCHDVMDEFTGSEKSCHARERPRHDQNDHRTYHCAPAFRDRLHEFFERYGASPHVEEERDNDGDQAAHNEAAGRIGIGKCIDKALALKETAGI